MRAARAARRVRAWSHVARARVDKALGRVPLPRVAWLIPTWYCDLRCVTCGVWRRPRDSSDMSPEQWRQVLRQVRFLDIVKLLGGEPFTRDDMVEIGRAVQEIVRPMIFQTVTAGKETDRIVAFAEAVGAPNLHLRISIDGVGEVHERLRGTPGLHAQAMATVNALLPLRARLGFHLGLNVAINDQTLPHLAPLVAMCREKGLSIAPGLAVSPFLEEADPAEHPPRVLMTHDKEAVRRALRETTTTPPTGYSLRERLSLTDMNDRIWDKMLSGAPATLRGPACEALRSFIYLLPDGGISACGLRQRAVGNLLTQPFDEIWSGAEARRRREEIGACVGCLQHSATVFSQVYGGQVGI